MHGNQQSTDIETGIQAKENQNQRSSFVGTLCFYIVKTMYVLLLWAIAYGIAINWLQLVLSVDAKHTNTVGSDIYIGEVSEYIWMDPDTGIGRERFTVDLKHKVFKTATCTAAANGTVDVTKKYVLCAFDGKTFDGFETKALANAFIAKWKKSHDCTPHVCNGMSRDLYIWTVIGLFILAIIVTCIVCIICCMSYSVIRFEYKD